MTTMASSKRVKAIAETPSQEVSHRVSVVSSVTAGSLISNQRQFLRIMLRKLFPDFVCEYDLFLIRGSFCFVHSRECWCPVQLAPTSSTTLTLIGGLKAHFRLVSPDT
jgi:hypothetical protein